jgi:hypothetical protein
MARKGKCSTYGQNRSTDAAFTVQEELDFMAGFVVAVRSTANMEFAWWDQDTNTLHCSYKGGKTYPYPCNVHQALAFSGSDSKMGFIWDHYLQGRTSTAKPC